MYGALTPRELFQIHAILTGTNIYEGIVLVIGNREEYVL